MQFAAALAGPRRRAPRPCEAARTRAPGAPLEPPLSADHAFVIARDPARPPEGLAGAVVAIGNFDGVHRGHAAVIARAQELARQMGRPCAVLTFEPHPADFFAGRSVVHRLTPPPAKAAALARLGVDGLIVLTFDAGLAGIDARAFVEDVLARRLGVAGVVAGYDFHFGKGRAGTPALLAQEGARLGLAVEIVDKIAADARGSLDAVHSSGVRDALERGDVALARQLLGRDYFVAGEIVHGQKLGRTIGFPTANLRLHASSALAYGIYAVRLSVEGTGPDRATYDGVASWGRRPTVDDGEPLLEVYVFDFSGDLYGKTVEVSFVEWIRPELKFDGLEALTAQIEKDCAQARALLAARAP
jgi:riboflavin kinase/FMN adenylyltransferase